MTYPPAIVLLFRSRSQNAPSRQLTEAQVDLTCVNCGLRSNVSVGFDFQVDLNASCLTNSSSCFQLTTVAMNMTIQELALSAALEVFIGKMISAGTNYK